MELKSQKNLYKHLWFLLMRHTHTHTHTHQRNTRNLSLEKSCYWAIHTKWSSVWYLPMSFSFSRLSLSWWTPAWTSRPSRSQDHLRTDCRERRPPHKDNITINNLTFLKLGVIQTKLTISWRGQEFFFICTSFGEWMGLALGTITPIHVCFTHWTQASHEGIRPCDAKRKKMGSSGQLFRACWPSSAEHTATSLSGITRL